ncbi:MAG: hypothetical protein ACKOSR_11895 [Flavobacteriales bacterium]
MKYPRLQELANNIQLQMERLKAGELSLEELDIVADQSRELYERLVVLRYKAFNETALGTATPNVQQTTTTEEIKPEPTAQVSLIDAIEEITQTTEKTEEQPMFTFDSTPAETPVANTLFDLAARPATPSVNEMLARTMTQQETLVQQHTHAPIADLKIAITLNQRFQFSRELFKGNNQEYEVAIDQLNTDTREAAMSRLQSFENKYEWNNSSTVVRDFRSLVERRHL